jgi:hypothetical protein
VGQPAILNLDVTQQSEGALGRSLNHFLRRLLPNSSANPKRRQHNNELRQWATAIVKKATPKMVKSLMEAAESLHDCMSRPANRQPTQAPKEPQDESLAALLLRLLHTGDHGETENVASTAPQTVSENPSLG